MFNYPGRKTILCIDDDDGMLRYQKALFGHMPARRRSE
jgi:hypothetical protein